MQDPFQNLLPDWQLINDNSTVFLFVVLVVPGFIIVFVRSQFKAGRVPSYPAGFLSYLATSTVYWAFLIFLIVPIVEFVAPVIRSHGLWWESFTYFTNPIKYFGTFILIVLLPAIIGICFGYNWKKNWIRGFLTKLRLNPVHPTPSAWDWTFEALGEQFVLVALRDGTHIGGLMGSDSFVSSDPAERDIYIQQIYDIDEPDNWKPMDHGVLIAGGEISSIEFWPLTDSGERANEKDQ